MWRWRWWRWSRFCLFTCRSIINPSTEFFGFWMICKSLSCCKVLVSWCCVTSNFCFLIIPVGWCNTSLCYKSSTTKVSVTWCSETSDCNFLCVPVSGWNFTESFVKWNRRCFLYRLWWCLICRFFIMCMWTATAFWFFSFCWFRSWFRSFFWSFFWSWFRSLFWSWFRSFSKI